jgi:hypothetical protein
MRAAWIDRHGFVLSMSLIAFSFVLSMGVLVYILIGGTA